MQPRSCACTFLLTCCSPPAVWPVSNRPQPSIVAQGLGNPCHIDPWQNIISKVRWCNKENMPLMPHSGYSLTEGIQNPSGFFWILLDGQNQSAISSVSISLGKSTACRPSVPYYIGDSKRVSCSVVLKLTEKSKKTRKGALPHLFLEQATTESKMLTLLLVFLGYDLNSLE